jgi:para-aminobenzoate synthetase component 1
MQVHQMISTVTSKLDWQYSAVEAIKRSYPMDRCTKISAMKIIDDLEETKEDYTAEQWVILRQMEISILM